MSRTPSNFNPRSREGSDGTVRKRDGHHGISIHAPARGATIANQIPGQLSVISIHAPARGATPSDTVRLAISGFQSTLPRGERLTSGRIDETDIPISIHAPARGATEYIKELHFDDKISIHAPARGATRSYVPVLVRCTNFNPRSREGSDNRNRIRRLCQKHFNPRSREGSDRCQGCGQKDCRYFNPRSREGSDVPLIPD